MPLIRGARARARGPTNPDRKITLRRLLFPFSAIILLLFLRAWARGWRRKGPRVRLSDYFAPPTADAVQTAPVHALVQVAPAPRRCRRGVGAGGRVVLALVRGLEGWL